MTAPSDGKIIETLLEHQWNTPDDFPKIWWMSRHREHGFDGACGICQGDIQAIAEVIEPIIREREAEAFDLGRRSRPRERWNSPSQNPYRIEVAP